MNGGPTDDEMTSRNRTRPRGRPPATDSAETRETIIDAARVEFAVRGFDATSLTSIASAAGLTPSALYHYFDGKEALYEAVVHRTIEVVWDGLLQRVRSGDDLATQVDLYIAEADRYGSDSRLFSSFLIGVPVEAKRNPAFASLAELLATWQTRVFDQLAETGHRTGELARFRSRSEASQALRLLLLGWSFETHYQPTLRAIRAEAARSAVAAWSA